MMCKSNFGFFVWGKTDQMGKKKEKRAPFLKKKKQTANEEM